ncbi:hypothetical protein D7V88_23435 [Corallococcus terminator]|uniref:Uncharacterized protein n=2 Tax=Corallococcus terminator TaxID=2316733 RepID=A0A3A8IKP7_9BACT|nr:hypothetical protein D7V88_23435 [Corallococcus terminator]
MLGACLFALGACDSKDDPAPDAGTDAGIRSDPDAGLPEYTALTPSEESHTLAWSGQPVSGRFAFIARAGRHYDFIAEGRRSSYSLTLHAAAGYVVDQGEPTTNTPFTWHWSGLKEGEVYTVDVSLSPLQGKEPLVFRFVDQGMDDHGDLPSMATLWHPSEKILTGRGGHPGARDVFAFNAIYNHVYVIDCTFPTYDWRLYFLDFKGGIHSLVDSASFAQTQVSTAYKFTDPWVQYVSIQDLNPAPSSAMYSCVLKDKGREEHGDTAASATTLLQGTSSVQGKIDFVGDIDGFNLGVLPGHFYRASCIPEGPAPCNVDAGRELDPIQSKMIFKALTPYFYGLRVQGDRVVPAQWVDLPYTLQFEDLGADDHGDTRATATPLTGPAQTVQGHVTDLIDPDVFSFQAVEGQRYQVSSEWREEQGQISSSIRDEMGSSVTAPRTHVGSRWVQDFTAPKTGTYFIELLADVEANLGDYTFQFEALAP